MDCDDSIAPAGTGSASTEMSQASEALILTNSGV